MRKLLFQLVLLVASVQILSAQDTMPKPRQVDDDYRKEYREAIREYNHMVKNLPASGDVIVIPIEEAVPVDVQQAGIMDFSNWGKPVMVPGQTMARILQAAKYQVRYDVFDTGIDDTHPDIKPILTGMTNHTTEPTPRDGQGHGTHVMGITVGQTGGVVYELAAAGIVKSYSHKVLNSSGSGTFADYAAALAAVLPDQKRTVDAGGFVVSNSSLGYQGAALDYVETPLRQAYEYGGITHTAAAGNAGSALGYPGKSDYVVAIGALDENLSRASYSNFGTGLDFVAPGSRINSTYKGGVYATLSGTSMGSPYGAGFFIAAYAVWGPKLAKPGSPAKYAAWIAKKLRQDDWHPEYGFGLAMLEKIPDSDPDDMPDDGTNPPPPADQGKTYSLVWDASGYTMRWKPLIGNQYNLLAIPATRLQCTTTAKTVQEAWDNCSTYTSNFFTNRAILGVNDPLEASWWSGRFLQIISAKTDTQIKPLELTGQDEQKRQFVTTGFDATKPTQSNTISFTAPLLMELNF